MKLNRFFSHWDQIHSGTLMVLDRFNQVDLSHIPFTGSWSVGEIALHIANAEDGWFGTIARKAYDKWPESQNMVFYPNIESIKSLLSETHSKTMAFRSMRCAISCSLCGTPLR